MASLTIDLPAELVARLEQRADETGQSLQMLVTDALVAHFPSTRHELANPSRIRLRPVNLRAWPDDTTFRREDIYGDDAR